MENHSLQCKLIQFSAPTVRTFGITGWNETFSLFIIKNSSGKRLREGLYVQVSHSNVYNLVQSTTTSFILT